MKSVGYNAGKEILEIEFDSGAIYQYIGVGKEVKEGLMSAESKGRYFNNEIRDNYEYIQLKGKGLAAGR